MEDNRIERDVLEKFLLNQTWWIDLSDEECNSVMTTVHGITVRMTHNKMLELEKKHNVRARLLFGG